MAGRYPYVCHLSWRYLLCTQEGGRLETAAWCSKPWLADTEAGQIGMQLAHALDGANGRLLIALW